MLDCVYKPNPTKFINFIFVDWTTLKGTVQIASLGDYPIMLSFEFSRLLPTFQSVSDGA